MRIALRARLGPVAYRAALGVLHAWWAVWRPRSRGVRCVLRDGEAIVLVRHSYGDRRWMLPGGRVRRGEDAIAAARREMLQELGVACRSWAVMGVLRPRDGWRRGSRSEGFRRQSTFYVEGRVDAAGRLSPRPGELDAASWFSAAQLPAERHENVDLALGGLR